MDLAGIGWLRGLDKILGKIDVCTFSGAVVNYPRWDFGDVRLIL